MIFTDAAFWKRTVEFAVTAAQVNSQVQQLVQQGYVLGKLCWRTRRTYQLGIESATQLSSLQARMNDVNEVLPADKQVDLTNIKLVLQSFANEIIDYDKLVDLLNAYMDEVSVATVQPLKSMYSP